MARAEDDGTIPGPTGYTSRTLRAEETTWPSANSTATVGAGRRRESGKEEGERSYLQRDALDIMSGVALPGHVLLEEGKERCEGVRVWHQRPAWDHRARARQSRTSQNTSTHADCRSLFANDGVPHFEKCFRACNASWQRNVHQVMTG